MASFNWLSWNQIVLFDEQSRGDTCGSCRRKVSFSVRGGAYLQKKKVLFRGGDSVEEKEIFLKRMTREGGEFWGSQGEREGFSC